MCFDNFLCKLSEWEKKGLIYYTSFSVCSQTTQSGVIISDGRTIKLITKLYTQKMQ